MVAEGRALFADQAHLRDGDREVVETVSSADLDRRLTVAPIFGTGLLSCYLPDMHVSLLWPRGSPEPGSRAALSLCLRSGGLDGLPARVWRLPRRHIRRECRP